MSVETSPGTFLYGGQAAEVLQAREADRAEKERRRSEAEALARRQEEEHQRVRREAELAALAHRAEQSLAAREERQRFISQPFAWAEQLPHAGDPRPAFVLSAWGAGLFDQWQARLAREQAEDDAGADAAGAAARDSAHHALAQKLRALRADTEALIAKARADAARHAAAAGTALAAGDDPAKHERAGADAQASAATLSARLPQIAANLQKAEADAARVEREARLAFWRERRAVRSEQQAARDAVAGARLRELVRDLLGVDEVPV